MSIKKIAVLFSGNGTNLEAILKKIHNKTFGDTTIKVALLICNNKNAKGIKKAQKFGLKTTLIDHKNFATRKEFDQKLVNLIKSQNIDLVVLAGFMRILTEVFTKNIKAINLHPSILPLFKGANAIKESFQSDMQVGGVSVHFVSDELDGGKIIAQKTFDRNGRNFEEWEAKIHKIEHEILPKTIINLLTKDYLNFPENFKVVSQE